MPCMPLTRWMAQEELDDVDVKVEGRRDVVVGAELILVPAADDQLCAIDQEHGEDKRTAASA